MGWLSALRSLFSGTPSAAPAEAAVETYRGIEILPDPIREGGQYRVAATLRKGGRSHRLIRADLLASREACVELSLAKARTLIDQQGDALFGPQTA